MNSQFPPILQLSKPLKNRLLFLLVGNLLLLGFILIRAAGSGSDAVLNVLSQFGPSAAPTILAGIGLTAVIFTGAIDLSIGAILVVAGTVFGILYERGATPVECYAGCFSTAVALSAYNAGLIRVLKIPAIIVTLAGLTFYRGAALVLATLAIPDFGGQVTLSQDAFHTAGRDYAGWILLAGIAVALWWEAGGKLPRTWLALGSSPTACRLKGLHPGRILQSSFLVSGLFLGLASLIHVSNGLTIEPSRMGRGFELEVIGGVVLGGTNIFGGEGSFLGTILGAVFLYLVSQAMVFAGISEYWHTAIQGAVIVVVIGFDCALHRKRKLMDELR